MAGDVFQKFKSSVNRGVTTISVKTSSTLEKSKIKTHIESLEREIQKDFTHIGEVAYKVWEDEKDDYSALNEWFESIKKKYEEITELTKQLSLIDERDKHILGTNSTEQPQESIRDYVCTNCGTRYEVPVKFCRKCGNKMEE